MKSKENLVDNILKNRVLAHLLFWLILVGVTTFLTSLNAGKFSHHLINNVVLLPTQMAAAYFLIYFQFPIILYKKKYILFIISCLISAFILSIVARLSIIYIAEPKIRQEFYQESLIEVLTDPIYLLVVYVPAVYMLPLILLLVKTIKDRFEEKSAFNVLEKEKYSLELSSLKAQIRPHFLFNTLNNLYSLTLEKSDLAPEIVIKLSEILDYMLYQCSDPKVPMFKELKLIQNYIDLELLRFGDQLDFSFKHRIDHPETKIAPLILLSIIENAFKHGVREDPNQPKVDIVLDLVLNHLYLTVFNTKPNIKQNDNENKSLGVGSVNIKRQLDLIYPKKHKLVINEKVNSYFLKLNIELE